MLVAGFKILFSIHAFSVRNLKSLHEKLSEFRDQNCDQDLPF